MSDSPPPIGALLRDAAPDRLAEVAHEYALAQFGATDLEVLLADYRLAGLSPLRRRPHPAGGPLIDTSAAGRCFGSQQPLVDPLDDGPCRVYLPLSAWGERLGVLLVDLPGAATGELVDELRGMAAELSVALLAADRTTDRYRRARRRRRLTMAAEMQWDLLPGRSLTRPEFDLAGQLEPAYAVCGDHFDWSLTDDRLTITVLNGDGQDVSAALLTSLAVNAMRNARRSGSGLAEQAGLASDALFNQHAGRRHAATLLLEVELATGRGIAIDAGSPRAMRVRGGEIMPVHLEQQLPLGMFADARYDPQPFALEPGDRLFVVSDGVHAAAPGTQVAFGERSLTHAIRRARLLHAPDAVGSVMRGLQEYHQGYDLIDDAVIVCLDWHGVPG